MAINTISDLRTGDTNRSISCRLSRKWLSYKPRTDYVVSLDLVFIDVEGNDIWSQIPAKRIDEYDSQLTEQKCYKVLNFSVKDTNPQYRPIPNLLMMNFELDTTVEEIPQIESILPYKFRFVKESEIPSHYGDLINLLDIRGYLVDYSPIKVSKSSANRTPHKDITIKLLEGDSISITLWGRLISQLDAIVNIPRESSLFLTITSLLVKKHMTKYNLSSSISTCIYSNINHPDIPLNQDRVMAQVAPRLVPTQSPIQHISVTVEELIALRSQTLETKTLSLNCVVHKIKHNWCYSGCSSVNCRRAVKETIGGFLCENCDRTSTSFVKRYRIVLTVGDDTGDIDVVLLDYEASRFLAIPADTLFQQTVASDKLLPMELSNLEGKHLLLHIKISKYDLSHPSSNLTIFRIIEDNKITYPAAANDSNVDKDTIKSPSVLSFTQVGAPSRSSQIQYDANTSTEVQDLETPLSSLKKRKIGLLDDKE